MKLTLNLFCSVILISFSCPLYSQEDYNDNMSQEEWEAWHDEYAKRVIILMSEKEKLEAQIDSLNKNNSGLDINNCVEQLYSLVGATKESISEFRKKFEETEKKINVKIGTPADIKKFYFDEITSSKIRCLPEFTDRYTAMKKKLFDVECCPGATDNYTVIKGDNLKKISKKILGSEIHWRIIFEANKNGVMNKDKLPKKYQTITNPNKIYPGQVLQVPKKII